MTSPSSVVTAVNSPRSGSVSGVARWAGVPARATSSANPAGELMRMAWVSSEPAWTVGDVGRDVVEAALAHGQLASPTQTVREPEITYTRSS